ncbi:DUF305 domain-containing protein [Mycetocola miduiensis]|uniref:Uncharacterized conserved protein, DUF305 family n=1 Tax=Mycetocola miduiensis TaxID=995034 RepID=A0A1I4ZY43_9MICO|nr:DUF305 domain-containing protein [Mycetocola miduiensis]SFN55020.1 Uncharacterized conserved protein, DUF305 family [Mycetocola miduiensis]
MKHIRRILIAATAVALMLSLAGCTGNDSYWMPGMGPHGMPSSPAAGERSDVNRADRMFTMMMIPHHEQAVEMSDLILEESDVDQRVLDLAQQIKDAQGPEIDVMESWLDDWGMPSSGGMDGMGHGDGMMSDNDMSALEAAEGNQAAFLFLRQMIEHHEGAIEMAEDELDDGTNRDVLALAQRILDSQTAEIATMKDLLADM